jgi:hypothetical protein
MTVTCGNMQIYLCHGMANHILTYKVINLGLVSPYSGTMLQITARTVQMVMLC